MVTILLHKSKQPAIITSIALALILPTPHTVHAGPPGLPTSVSNPLEIPRRGEMVEVDWAGVRSRLPDIQAEAVTVLDDDRPIPTQVVRTDSRATLLFRADFAARETRRFTITSDNPIADEPRARALFVEHPDLDFMAWENDRIAFRLCEKRLVSSGVDVWAKRVTRPILDSMSKRDYHVDNGEGVDCYKVGEGRGCGGFGIWRDGKLHVLRNFKSYKILAEGPLRTVIELTYAPWDTGGIQAGEVKRISLDAGSQLNRIESRLDFAGTETLTAVAGLTVPKAAATTQREKDGWAAVWQTTDGKENGMLGIGLVATDRKIVKWEPSEARILILLPVTAGKTLVYHAGAGWSKHGFADAAAWNDYLEGFARRLASPLKIELPASP
ncbi:MAG: DUF4861 family protein [Verrucomicrobiales bacterium]